jgi:tRNA A-37 threonylcarbamoyl transferase component Bud32
MNARSLDCEQLLRALQREGLDTVEGAFAHVGGEDLDKPNLTHRRRTRFSVTDDTGRTHELYLKRYEPESMKARLRRRWTYGPRRSPGGVEFENIRSVRAAGVATMREIIFGEEFGLLGARRSYLIVTSVPGDALERRFEDFLRRHGAGEMTRRLTEKLAAMIKALHTAGHVHRDLYASHVFLDESDGDFGLYLIDLGRMFSPRWRKFRWKVKDLAQLKYSMPRMWVEQFWDEFLRVYGTDFDAVGMGRYRRAIDRKVTAMRRRRLRRPLETVNPKDC